MAVLIHPEPKAFMLFNLTLTDSGQFLLGFFGDWNSGGSSVLPSGLWA